MNFEEAHVRLEEGGGGRAKSQDNSQGVKGGRRKIAKITTRNY